MTSLPSRACGLRNIGKSLDIQDFCVSTYARVSRENRRARMRISRIYLGEDGGPDGLNLLDLGGGQDGLDLVGLYQDVQLVSVDQNFVFAR